MVTNGYSTREMKEEVKQKKSIHIRYIFLSPAVRVKAEDTFPHPPKYPSFGGSKMHYFMDSKKKKESDGNSVFK